MWLIVLCVVKIDGWGIIKFKKKSLQRQGVTFCCLMRTRNMQKWYYVSMVDNTTSNKITSYTGAIASQITSFTIVYSLNRLFRRRSKKTSKLRVTGLIAGNSPVTGEFPAQMASYAENVSIWWRHHVLLFRCCSWPIGHWKTFPHLIKYRWSSNADS